MLTRARRMAEAGGEILNGVSERRWTWSACAALLVLLVACASDPQTPSNGASTGASRPGAASPGMGEGHGHEGWHRSKSEHPSGSGGEKPGGRASPGGDGGAASEGDETSSSDGTAPAEGSIRPDGRDPSGGGSGGRRSSGAGPRGRAPARATYPASGRYVYSQDGFEEFCSTTCDRRGLPNTQEIDTRARRGGGSWIVTTTARASQGRIVRTTARYDRTGASIVRVYLEYSYEGFTFNDTYQPDPPVRSLRFPLEVGDRWSGSWRGDVSGTYSVSVDERETMHAGGRRVGALRLSTRTTFRGDFDGTANTTLWVDPRTKAIVATAGNVNVKSSFGRYSSGFHTRLRSGPAY